MFIARDHRRTVTIYSTFISRISTFVDVSLQRVKFRCVIDCLSTLYRSFVSLY